MTPAAIVSKLWNYCNVLRDDGMSYEGRWRSYTYDELVSRDKASLDIFWLKDIKGR